VRGVLPLDASFGTGRSSPSSPISNVDDVFCCLGTSLRVGVKFVEMLQSHRSPQSQIRDDSAEFPRRIISKVERLMNLTTMYVNINDELF
jgi:hypothetical protein